MGKKPGGERILPIVDLVGAENMGAKNHRQNTMSRLECNFPLFPRLPANLEAGDLLEHDCCSSIASLDVVQALLRGDSLTLV